MKLYSAVLLQVLILGGMALPSSVVYAQKAKTDSRRVTTKLSSNKAATPTLINRDTGKKVTVQQALDASTEAGYSYPGGGSPGGLYYTPGPPIYTPALTVPSTTAATSDDPLMSASTLGGGMWLLQKGGLLLQPLAGLGNPLGEKECKDCKKKSSELGSPTSDPNTKSAEEKLAESSNSLGEAVNEVTNNMEAKPFQYQDGTTNTEYTEYLMTILQKEPFDQLYKDAADEIAEFCPNYKNLKFEEQQAITNMMFSQIMQRDGYFNPKRELETGEGNGVVGYGLCSITLPTAERLIKHYSPGFTVTKKEDLFKPQTNINLCVMEVRLLVEAYKKEGKPIRPFQNLHPSLNAEVKKKMSNYRLCKKAETPTS